MKNKSATPYVFLLLLGGLLLGPSCKKWVAADPPQGQVVAPDIFKAEGTARAAVNGLYSEMMHNSQQFTANAVTLYGGMSADELYYFTPGGKDEFVHNAITPASHGTIATLFWAPAYRYVYWANTAVEGLGQASSLPPGVQKALLGEVKFIRAFCYFHLVQFFGDVPLATSSDYSVNRHLPRAPKRQVYAQVVRDLQEAYEALGADGGTYRVRPSRWAAAALLSRVYLYEGDWASAEAWASKVIASGAYALNGEAGGVFRKESPETIWQLQPVHPTRNTWEGYLILPSSSSSIPTYLLRPSLVAAFEEGDQRKGAWVQWRVYGGDTLYYPGKYKVHSGAADTEYYVVLRLSEQYLVRAEARLQQNKLPGALQDLNAVRGRAGLPHHSMGVRGALAEAIAQERRVELAFEWGHRWFDLKRRGAATAVLGALKGSHWQPTDELYPIPQSQISANGVLTQNPGY